MSDSIMVLVEADQQTAPGWGRWGSLLGEVTCEFRHWWGRQFSWGEKREGYQEEAPDLKGPMLTGAETFRVVGGALCRGWGCETSLERGRWQEGERVWPLPVA